MTTELWGYDQALILRVDAVALVFFEVTESGPMSSDPVHLKRWIQRVVQPDCRLGWRIVETYAECIFQGAGTNHTGSFD